MARDKKKQRECQKIWIRNRRISFFQDKKCVRCSSTEQLELDHIDPAQKIDHRIWSWSLERQAEEIAKCQVLCRACHAAKSMAELGLVPTPHGYVRYDRYGCRCEICKAAKGVRMRKYAEKRSALRKQKRELRHLDVTKEIS